MAETISAATDRDILLDAIVQRLKARKPTAELGKRIEKAVQMLRSMERSEIGMEDPDDPTASAEFMREVATGLAAKILADRRPSSLDRLRRDWDTLTKYVESILATAPPVPARRAYLETAHRQLMQWWFSLDVRPSSIRHILDNAKDARGIALHLLWAGRQDPDTYADPEDLRRALKRVTAEAPW